MHSDDFGGRGASASIEISQGENGGISTDKSRMLLILLENFVSGVISDAMINNQVQPEVGGRPFIGVYRRI
jgi:hypothetical protein